MKKKILAISLVVSLVAVAALGVTLAYFTATDDVTNTFTMGNVAIELAEPSWAADTQFTGVTGVEPEGGWGAAIANPLLPGDTAAKDPQVKNTGSNAAYVRLKVTISNYSGFVAAAAKYDELYPTGSLEIIDDVVKGLNDTDWEIAGTPVEDSGNDTVTYTFNYVGGSNGGKLLTTEKTSALFTGIALPDELDQDVLGYIQDGFEITVKAEAIQAENLSATEAFAELGA